MQQKPCAPRFFLGANTPQGFVSRFDQLGDPAQGWRLYIIKGGPGTGKSTLMKQVAEKISPACGRVEYIHCSSDVSSLDGVILPDLRVSLADGTPPHALEPKYPGAYENVVPLTSCWDRKLLFQNRGDIMALSQSVSKCHEYCVRFLAAAGSLAGDSTRIAQEATDPVKIQRCAAGIMAREARPTGKTKGRESVRFLSAITDKGPTFFHETAQCLCGRLYLIDDDYGAASRQLLACLRSQLLDGGYDVISCYCPLAPYDKLEHLLVPSLGLGFLTSNRFHRPPVEPDRIIHARRFTDMDALHLRKKRMTFNLKGAGHMLDQAAQLMAEAKATHDKLEAYYRAATDFAAVEAMGDQLADEILSR